jgi:nucleoid DNA-binding protein
MDELVKQVAKKTGLPEATAKTAVQTVIGFLKKK